MPRVTDLHVSTNTALPSPRELCQEIPEGDTNAALVADSRSAISRILSGEDSRFLVIVARTSESQTHRQMASGLSMPVGFKNVTSGAVVPAINGIKAAMQPQTFLGINEDGRASMVTTTGNKDCHLILRGGDDGPNHD